MTLSNQKVEYRNELTLFNTRMKEEGIIFSLLSFCPERGNPANPAFRQENKMG
jgi:hypothetical protein